MPKPSDSNSFKTPSSRSQALRDRQNKYAYLKAEAKAPYRILRKFIYVAFGASGFIGSLVFFVQVLTLQDVSHTVPNLVLQLGVVSLMVWLFRVDRERT